MSGRRVDWRRAAGAGINGAVIGAVRGAMTASGVGAAAAFAGNFAAGTAGSALEQWIGTGNVSARRSVAGGLINAVNNAVYKDYVFKSGTQALKKGFLAGGARAGIEYLSETLGKPSKYDRNRRSARRSYMPESRDPRMSCGREDPLGKSLGYSSARGYQYKNPQTNRGFRLGEFIGTVLRGGLMEGLNNLMFFEAGKAVEALGVSVSPHEGKNRGQSNSGQGFSQKGYNPQEGERTLNGYVKQNANPEVALYTKSEQFNNSRGNAGGQFKRLGAEEHYGLSPHVHQPVRNIAPNGTIYGKTGKTVGVDTLYPSSKDVKQLYEYFNNSKYHK